jgi:propionyl-CoA carboxylase alpha chain
LSAIAAFVAMTHEARAVLIDGQLGDPLRVAREHVVRLDGGAEHHVAMHVDRVVVDGGAAEQIEIDYEPGQRIVEARIGNRRRIVQVAKDGRNWKLATRGATHRVSVMTPLVASLARHMIDKVPPDLSRFLLAPMPGLLTRLDVAVGDKVEGGQAIAVVEAMKMENILRAGKTGVVKATPAAAGESLIVDQVIVEFE